MKGNLRYKIQEFMRGRYGNDELSHFLSILIFPILIISIAFSSKKLVNLILLGVALLLFIITWVRMLSKNYSARYKENQAFLKVKNAIVNPIRTARSRAKDKDHKYYKCPNCGATVRITKPSKGKTIVITCPKCNKDFEKRT